MPEEVRFSRNDFTLIRPSRLPAKASKKSRDALSVITAACGHMTGVPENKWGRTPVRPPPLFKTSSGDHHTILDRPPSSVQHTRKELMKAPTQTCPVLRLKKVEMTDTIAMMQGTHQKNAYMEPAK